ncbi:MAG: mechanosensitive ion channel [Desulfobacterales bacterium]|jgi:potassium efflux system protein
MKMKFFGHIAIGSIWLLLITLPKIQAQETATLPSMTAASTVLSIEELNSRRAEIESIADIDAAVKADSLAHIDQAITHLELANNLRQKEHELAQLIQTAPERMNLLQDELKKPFMSPETVKARARRMSTEKLERRLVQKEGELVGAQTRLKEWKERLNAEKVFNNQTTDQLKTINSQLKEIQVQLESISDTTEEDILNYSRMISLRAGRDKLGAEIKLIELRQRSHSLLIELYSLETDVARKAENSRQNMLQIWQAELQKRRRQEAFQTREDAQDAMVKVSLMPKVVQEQFAINIQLGADLEKVTLEETKLAKLYEDYQIRLKLLEEEFDTAQKRVEFAVITEAIGLALRTQRLKLPSIHQYLAVSEARQIRMSEIGEKQIKLDRLERELSDPKDLEDRLIGSVGILSSSERIALEAEIQQLIGTRLDIIQKLKSGYDRIFKLMQNNEFIEQRIVKTAEDFGELLDRHLLWIRSSRPISFNDLEGLEVSLKWFFNSVNWKQLVKDIGRSIYQKPIGWILGLLIGLLLIVCRSWARKKLKYIAECVDQQVEDSFLLTIQALGLTVLLAAVWPFLLTFPAYQLRRLSDPEPFSLSMAGGVIFAIRVLIFLILLYNICRSNGLAQVHFQWHDTSRRTLKRNLGWLIPILFVLAFFVGAMENVSEVQFSDALAKLSLMMNALAFSIFTARILRFKGGITSELIEKYPQSWLCRLRYVWYPLAILLPLTIIWLIAIGYFYSAREIGHLISNTIVLVLMLIVFNDLVLRILILARRRIALKKAIADQELRLKADSKTDADADTDGVPVIQNQPIIGLRQIDEQTRSLLKLILFILALSGMWVIWDRVFPAFGILQDIKFWSYSTVVDGVPKTVPITLAKIILAIIVAATTIVASRNLPGLLEVILLKRLPMRPGARYAYSSVSRYAITAIGILIALNTIGLRWSNLQWLIAALSVGLGFGLQEIVANFISGLIVLFERPFRVGDTVTVGEVHGTVTRIRIRATTIQDWDRKELIVPNKEFITGQLINWSLTDNLIRFKVPVGIAYGSDTDLAEKLLLKVAKSNPLVKKTPEPKAVFLSFGDNALNFEVRVYVGSIDDWVPMMHEMNRAIDKEFRQAGISIAFPQRDVHLDAAGPLDIRVVSDEPSSSTSSE